MNTTLLQILMVSAAVNRVSNNILKTDQQPTVNLLPQKDLIKCEPIYVCYNTSEADLAKAKDQNIARFKTPCQKVTEFGIHPDFIPDCHSRSLYIYIFIYGPFDHEKKADTQAWLLLNEYHTEIEWKSPVDGPCLEIQKYIKIASIIKIS